MTKKPKPAGLLKRFWPLIHKEGPVLDLACGDGRNGIFLARKGFRVSCWDVSEEILDQARLFAGEAGINVEIRQVDLEEGSENPFPQNHYAAVLVFRYLHRPLIPPIKDALKTDGLLFYSTFTSPQTRFGKPKNPDHLLKPGELLTWFKGWRVHHYFEGILQNPPRAMAQIVCQKIP